MLLQKTQLENFQDVNNYYTLEGSQYCHLYSDFLFGTGLFNVYLNGAINNTLGGGIDLGGHPGQVILTTGTTASGEGRIGSGTIANIKLDTTVCKFETCIQLPVLSTNVQEYEINIGIINASRDVTYGCYFFYDPINAGNNWQAFCKVNNIATIVNSNISVVANNWYRLTVIATTTKADFYINGNLIANITTNIPDNTVLLAPITSIAKWAGTTARVMNVDYLEFLYKLNR